MAITTDSILTALKGGTYTLDTLTTDRFFKVEQPEKRRRFPSVELIEIQPISSTGTQKAIDLARRFEVRVYLRLRGGQVEGQTDEIDTIETLETEIQDTLDGTVLGEHKIIAEDKQWNRTTEPNAYPPFIKSTLTVVLRQIKGLEETPDGVLVFDLANSSVDNPPGADRTYQNIFDVDILEGYRDVDEQTNQDANPKRYSGGFNGTFIGHTRVHKDDLGATGEKLNQLTKLRSNGEKPTVQFIYTDKDQQTPSPSTITRTLKMTIENIQELYRSGDNTIFRILGRLLEPSTLSAS